MAKGMYIGGPTEFPIYEEREVTTTTNFYIKTLADLFAHFSVSYGGEHGFTCNDVGQFFSTNDGIDDSTAMISLSARYDMPTLSFSYSCSSEENFDELIITLNGGVVDTMSGASDEGYYLDDRTWSGSLSKGDTIIFEYSKDGRESNGYDQAMFEGIQGTYTTTTIEKVQVGTEIVDVARKVTKQYTGINGVARKVKRSYAEVNGVARQFFPSGVDWMKYNCEKIEASFNDEHPNNVLGTDEWPKGYFYPDYSLIEDDDGEVFEGIGDPIYAEASGYTDSGDIGPASLVGMYGINTYENEDGTRISEVWEITGWVDDRPYGGSTYFELVCIHASISGYVYRKGGTSYGTVNAPEGKKPEDGERIAGSPTADWCVLYNTEDGLYFYYERV